MNSLNLDRCHAKFGHACDGRLSIDTGNDPQLNDRHAFKPQRVLSYFFGCTIRTETELLAQYFAMLLSPMHRSPQGDLLRAGLFEF